MAALIFLSLFISLEIVFGSSAHPSALDALSEISDGQGILEEARSISPWTVGVRRRLHQHPELLYELNETIQIVKDTLDELGISYRVLPKFAIIAQIGTGEGPVVALRADLDALPISEQIDSEFKSQHEGKMHACGHDGHTAMLLGAAKLLKKREASLQGTVKFLFQPAEEGGAGGLYMIQEGALQNPAVDRIFGLHLWPSLPSGSLASRAGPLMAAPGVFEVTLHGVSGHAAMPGTFVDPIVAASACVQSLQTIVSRNIKTTDNAVVSVTKIHGGDAFNIIPDSVSFGGTLRSFTREGYARLEERVKHIINNTAAAYGVRMEWESQILSDECLSQKTKALPAACVYPPLLNDKKSWDFAKISLADIFPPDNIFDTEPTMGGEDFAYFLEKVPGAFLFLGNGNPMKNTTFGLHNSRFTLDEDVLPYGVAVHTQLALDTIRSLSASK